MDFDLLQITVPFRMQPGLARVDATACQLTPLDPRSALHAEKQAVWRAGQSRHALPGVDEQAILATIAAHAPAGVDPTRPLELQFEEDFALLDGASGTVPWMCLCVPSHWAPEDKLGQSLSGIHAPVADASLLQQASDALTRLVTSGEHWQRHVWTISPSARFDQHPKRHARTPWPASGASAAFDADEAFAQQCHLRAERQSFLPVAGTTQAVFAIRVMLQPLTQAVSDAARAARLHDALASMSDAVLHYKGLDDARAPLLRWLERRAQTGQATA